MDLRCPKCGSCNLHVDKRGFSTKRAVAGALITGNVLVAGAAGLAGSNKVKITCLDCGEVFNVGEGAHEKPKKVIESGNRVIPRNEMPVSQMYMCECGKTFSSDKKNAHCPKCGRMMNEENKKKYYENATEVWEKTRNGCIVKIVILVVVILAVCFLIF